MRTPLTLIAAAALLPLAACTEYDRPGYASGPYAGGGYGHGGHYRPGDTYGRPGYLSERDYIYRDGNGNYYCKRPDGSTGAIVGGLAGGVLGNIVAPGGSKTLGTVLGALGGAVAGTVVDRSNIRCE